MVLQRKYWRRQLDRRDPAVDLVPLPFMTATLLKLRKEEHSIVLDYHKLSDILIIALYRDKHLCLLRDVLRALQEHTQRIVVFQDSISSTSCRNIVDIDVSGTLFVEETLEVDTTDDVANKHIRWLFWRH